MNTWDDEEHQHYLDWLDACEFYRVTPPSEVIAAPLEQLRSIGSYSCCYCQSCKCPVLHEEFIGLKSDVSEGRPARFGGGYFCPDCYDGQPGHSDYHAYVDFQRDIALDSPKAYGFENRGQVKALARIRHEECPYAEDDECGRFKDRLLHFEGRITLFSDDRDETVVQAQCTLLHSVELELWEHLLRNPGELQSLKGTPFEDLLNSILRNHGFKVIPIGGVGDNGIDLKAIHHDSIGPLVTLVQAKGGRTPVRIDPVRSLMSLVSDTKAHRGLFVTTSRFMPQVHRYAEQELRLTLADGNQVIRWLEELRAATRKE